MFTKHLLKMGAQNIVKASAIMGMMAAPFMGHASNAFSHMSDGGSPTSVLTKNMTRKGSPRSVLDVVNFNRDSNNLAKLKDSFAKMTKLNKIKSMDSWDPKQQEKQRELINELLGKEITDEDYLVIKDSVLQSDGNLPKLSPVSMGEKYEATSEVKDFVEMYKKFKWSEPYAKLGIVENLNGREGRKKFRFDTDFFIEDAENFLRDRSVINDMVEKGEINNIDELKYAIDTYKDSVENGKRLITYLEKYCLRLADYFNNRQQITVEDQIQYIKLGLENDRSSIEKFIDTALNNGVADGFARRKKKINNVVQDMKVNVGPNINKVANASKYVLNLCNEKLASIKVEVLREHVDTRENIEDLKYKHTYEAVKSLEYGKLLKVVENITSNLALQKAEEKNGTDIRKQRDITKSIINGVNTLVAYAQAVRGENELTVDGHIGALKDFAQVQEGKLRNLEKLYDEFDDV